MRRRLRHRLRALAHKLTPWQWQGFATELLAYRTPAPRDTEAPGPLSIANTDDSW